MANFPSKYDTKSEVYWLKLLIVWVGLMCFKFSCKFTLNKINKNVF